MARARVAPAALLFFLMLGCVAPAATTIPPTEDVLRPLRPTAENTPTKANTPAATARATPEATPTPKPPGCLGIGDIKDIQNEYAANPYRARGIYVGQKMCLSGKIAEFYTLHDRRRVISAHVRDDFGFAIAIGHPEIPHSFLTGYIIEDWYQRHDWWNYFMEASVGDEIKTECEIQGLSRSDDRPPGTPLITGCKWVRDDQPDGRLPPSYPAETKAVTWEFLLAPSNPEVDARAVLSLEVPSDWEWDALLEERSGEHDGIPYSRFLRGKDGFLPFVALHRSLPYGTIEWREDELKKQWLRGEIATFEISQDTVGGITVFYESITHIAGSPKEREYERADAKYFEVPDENYYYGLGGVVCNSAVDDAQQKAICDAVLDSFSAELFGSLEEE